MSFLNDFIFEEYRYGYSIVKNLNKDVEEVEIPSSYNGKPILRIHFDAFRDCKFLSKVIIPDCVEWVGKHCFRDCLSLKSVLLGNLVDCVDDGTFKNCTSLTSIVLSNAVNFIGYSAFEGCTSLMTIVIPKSVKEIRAHAFSNCNSLKKIYFLGTKEQWNKIAIGINNIGLDVASIVYCCE